MTHWAMVIDLTRCIGCKSCIAACSHANGIPEGLWRKLHTLPDTEPPERKSLFATKSCMHCAEPPCRSVCPTGATFQRPDGIVEIDYEKCIGCGYCILACPYDVRVIYRYSHFFESDAPFSEHIEGISHQNREGVCTKCNFCSPRIESGLKRGLTPGVDPDATPFCVVSCSCGALSFGDADDPESQVSKLIEMRRPVRLLSELKTKPSLYYIVP